MFNAFSHPPLAPQSKKPVGPEPLRRPILSLRMLALPLFAALCVIVLCTNLGLWQLRRAEFKESLRSRYENATAPLLLTRAENLAEWQRVTLRGEWQPRHGVLLDNRLRHGQAGFEVLTPLRLDGDGGIVIVDRGWIANNGDRTRLPQIPTPAGRIEISGLAIAAVAPGFSLAAPQQDGAIWQKADLASFERLLGQRVGAWLVRQESAAPDTLDRHWPAPDFGAERHRAYAWQWFALAVTALALCIWHTIRALRCRQPTPPHASLPASSHATQDVPRDIP